MSRIAESLFWIGRYVERVDGTARILQVQLRIRVEDPWVPENESCRNLLALMGVDVADTDAESIDQGDLLAKLGYDLGSPTSIATSIGLARENARRAREVIPSSLWETWNKTWQTMPRGQVSFARSASYLDWARERAALFTGVARQSMVRDEGWQFLLLGRSIEQVDMTARLLASTEYAGNGWPAVLRGVGCYDAFLRTYRGFRADREAAEFLILDDRMPRSIMHGLDASFHSLATIRGGEHLARADDPLRILGRLQARVRYSDIEQMMDRLADEMQHIQQTCDEVSKAITREFFAAMEQPAWTTERAL